MRITGPIAAASLLLVPACGSPSDIADAPAKRAGNAGPGPAAAPRAAAPDGRQWKLQFSGEGAALALPAPSGGAALRLSCPAGDRELLVNVPAFRPVGSEERLSFGGGGEVATLVADTRGDAARGGVTGAGPAPANLAALLAGPVAVNYGTQNSGPHPAPPPDLARDFAAACAGGASSPADPPPGAAAGVGPCMMQDSERLAVTPIRAVGTEPFWGARIDGRCVTYTHPDDQAGTRIWTRYTPSPGGGTWTGALHGQRFELRTRAAPGCSDGMSDTRHPIAVELRVGVERRQGCAAPL